MTARLTSAAASPCVAAPPASASHLLQFVVCPRLVTSFGQAAYSRTLSESTGGAAFPHERRTNVRTAAICSSS